MIRLNIKDFENGAAKNHSKVIFKNGVTYLVPMIMSNKNINQQKFLPRGGRETPKYT